MTNKDGLTQAEYDADFPSRSRAIDATIKAEVARLSRREDAQRQSLLCSLVEDWYYQGLNTETTDADARAAFELDFDRLGPDNIAWIIKSEDPVRSFYDSI